MCDLFLVRSFSKWVFNGRKWIWNLFTYRGGTYKELVNFYTPPKFGRYNSFIFVLNNLNNPMSTRPVRFECPSAHRVEGNKGRRKSHKTRPNQIKKKKKISEVPLSIAGSLSLHSVGRWANDRSQFAVTFVRIVVFVLTFQLHLKILIITLPSWTHDSPFFCHN